MTAKHSFTLLALCFILASGCAEQRQAEAHAIRRQTARADDRHRLAMEREAAVMGDKVQAERNLVMFGQIGLMVLAGGGIGIALYWGRGMAQASVRQQQFQATLIPLDEATRQYPLLPYEGPRGTLRVYNPNTNSVLRLDRGHEVNLALADNAAKVQVAGLLPDRQEVIG